MTEGELIKLIKDVVKKEFTQTLLATVTGTDNSYLSSMRRFSTDSEVSDLRLIFPYGFNSRPPEDTECVIGAINSDPSHLVNLGQFDNGNRPTIDEGESVLYGPNGQIIYATKNDIQFGTYVQETGTILPTYFGKIDTQTGDVTFHNLIGAKMTLDGTTGEATLGNTIGKFQISATGQATVDGGGGASHGIGLGDVIENRLSALENALATLTSVFGTAHTHTTISLGSPTSPPIPPATPFVPVPIPVGSLTAQVST